MDITSLGLSSFRIRGKSVSVVMDPFTSSIVGVKFPKVDATIVTVSHEHEDHNNTGAVGANPFIVRGPGEYEVVGVPIVGIPTFHDDAGGEKRGRNTVYRMEIDGISVAHLGDLGHVLTSDQVNALDGVDILLIPVGGTYTIDAAQAVAVINELDPKVVIPMHYGKAELNQQVFGALAPVTAFLAEIGKEDVTPQPKLSVTKEKLPEEMQVVILE